MIQNISIYPKYLLNIFKLEKFNCVGSKIFIGLEIIFLMFAFLDQNIQIGKNAFIVLILTIIGSILIKWCLNYLSLRFVIKQIKVRNLAMDVILKLAIIKDLENLNIKSENIDIEKSIINNTSFILKATFKIDDNYFKKNTKKEMFYSFNFKKGPGIRIDVMDIIPFIFPEDKELTKSDQELYEDIKKQISLQKK